MGVLNLSGPEWAHERDISSKWLDIRKQLDILKDIDAEELESCALKYPNIGEPLVTLILNLNQLIEIQNRDTFNYYKDVAEPHGGE